MSQEPDWDCGMDCGCTIEDWAVIQMDADGGWGKSVSCEESEK